MSNADDRRYVRVAALQPPLRVDAHMPNLHLLRQTADRLVAEAPLDLLVLPEVFDGILKVDRSAEQAEQSRQFLSTLARACRVNVIGGSIGYVDGAGLRYNSCFLVDRTGREVARYDKRVLFSREADRRIAGTDSGIVELDGLRIGVLICADLWWPEPARAMLDRVDVLCVPAKTTVATEPHTTYARAVWHNLALVRAMENGVAVVVSDWSLARHDHQRTTDGVRTAGTHYTSGASTICDPGHRPELERMQRTLHTGVAGVLRADIDLQRLIDYRAYRRSVGLLPGQI